MSTTPKILAFGTFDLLHPGHKFLLKKAAKLGHLTVVLARDATVKKIKGRPPIWDEKKRRAAVAALPYVHSARFGYVSRDKLKVVREENPDVIVLGYDQKWFVDLVKGWAKINKRQVVVLPAHHPKKFKSSVLRNSINQ